MKLKLSGAKAAKPMSMAEQLAAASKKLVKVETKESPTITSSSGSQKPAGGQMSLAEQLQAAQAKMKPAAGQKPLPPKQQEAQLSFAEQIALANSKLKKI